MSRLGEIVYEEDKNREPQPEPCTICEGDGYIIYSCCGDDMKSDINETDICPSCGEHCGDAREDCEECE